MATKQFNITGIQSQYSPRSGWTVIGLSNDTPPSNYYADITFPALSGIGPIQEVKLYFPWNNASAGVGGSGAAYHTANGYQYYIEGASGTTSVVLPLGYSTTSNWNVRIRGSGTGAIGTYKGYSWGIYAIVTYQSDTAPTPPTSVACSPNPFENTISISYPGARPGENNPIRDYHIYYQTSSDGINWSAESGVDTNSTATSYTFNSAAIGRSQYFRCRVYSIGTTMNSGPSPYSNTIRKNQPAAAPTVTSPVNGSTIYDPQPRLLLRTGTDPDNQTQRLHVYTPGTGWINNVDNPAYFSINTWLGNQQGLICQLPAASGALSVGVRVEKQGGVFSATTTRNYTIASPSWTDITLVVHETPVKAAHLNELRAVVDNTNAFYGRPATAWQETITAGSTKLANWTTHVNEIRSAIDALIAYVNGFDGAASKLDIPIPAWIPIPTNSVRADVIAQIRLTIVTL